MSERRSDDLPEAASWRWWVNGALVEPGEAVVSAGDAGVQHAVGVFTTMRAWPSGGGAGDGGAGEEALVEGEREGVVWRLDRHVERVVGSMVELGMAAEGEAAGLRGELRTAVEACVAGNGLGAARLRLTVTPGSVTLRPPGREKGAGASRGSAGGGGRTVLVEPSPVTAYDPAYFERGVRVVVHGPGANPFDDHAGHKTVNYWSRLSSLRRAAEAGAAEAIWLNVTNHLASGAISNLFVVKDGVLRTPIARGEEVQGALRAPVLPGVVRGAVIEWAEGQGIEVERRMLTVEDLLDADEVFLTNSGWLVLPVSGVEQKEIGSGAVGDVTRRVRAGLAGMIAAETGVGG
ncbi:MAG: aminotransferase class IV [Planctomycetota bacterium]